MRASYLAFLLLSACATTRPDPALEARRACVRELNEEAIRSGEDFIALGLRKEAEAEALPDDVEKARALRCSLAAFEAATALSARNPAPYLGAARAYAALGQRAPAAAMYRRALGLGLAAPDRARAEAWLRAYGD